MDQYEHPLIGPLMKALQMKAYVEEIHHRREQREREREIYADDLQQRQRQRALGDLDLTMRLASSGARQGPSAGQMEPLNDPSVFGQTIPGTERQPWSGPIGPGGETRNLWLPNEKDRQARTIQDSVNAAQAHAAGVDAVEPLEDVTPPEGMRPIDPMRVAGDLPPVPWKVRRSHVPAVEMEAYRTANPPMTIREHTNAEGDVTREYVNPRTQQTIKTETLPGIGKPSATKATGPKRMVDITAEAEDEALRQFGGEEYVPNPDYEAAIKKLIANRIKEGRSRNEEEARWFFTSPDSLAIPENLETVRAGLKAYGLVNKGAILDKISIKDTPGYKQKFNEARRRLLKEDAANRATGSGSGSKAKSTATKRPAQKDPLGLFQ